MLNVPGGSDSDSISVQYSWSLIAAVIVDRRQAALETTAAVHSIDTATRAVHRGIDTLISVSTTSHFVVGEPKPPRVDILCL